MALHSKKVPHSCDTVCKYCRHTSKEANDPDQLQMSIAPLRGPIDLHNGTTMVTFARTSIFLFSQTLSCYLCHTDEGELSYMQLILFK